MAEKSRKQQLEEMLAEDPNDPFLRYGLAMEHAGAGAHEEAANGLRGRDDFRAMAARMEGKP